MLPILLLVSNERNTGKTTFLRFLKMIFGKNATFNTNEDFRSQFNADWANRLLVLVDELLLNKIEDTEKIKNLSTAGDYKIEAKGKDRREIEFFAKFVLCSNNEKNPIIIPQEEVRFWVRKIELVAHPQQTQQPKMMFLNCSEHNFFFHCYLTVVSTKQQKIKIMSLNDIKKISIKGYLARRGITPKTEKPGSGMYLSPLREERMASFSVNYNENVWYDHGTGEGGSIIDLVVRMENCSVGEAIGRLEDNATNGIVPSYIERERSNVADKSRIEILSVAELTHPALVGYLRDRGIDQSTVQKYCHEVRYSIGGREYFAIGFKNDAGGWELRNRNFKGSSTPKNITTIQNGSDTVMVFEGFFDFLSYLSLKNNPSPTIDTAILNSVTNLAKAIPFLQSHRTVHAFLDNDDAGRKALTRLREKLPGSEVVDQSPFYRNHADLNDYWREKSKPGKRSEPTNAAVQIKRQIPVKKRGGGPKF